MPQSAVGTTARVAVVGVQLDGHTVERVRGHRRREVQARALGVPRDGHRVQQRVLDGWADRVEHREHDVLVDLALGPVHVPVRGQHSEASGARRVAGVMAPR